MKHKTPGVTDELLLKASEEFLSEGFQGASLRKIATAAGVSTNSIYGRFVDKRGLFDAIVKETADEFLNMVTDMNGLVKTEDKAENVLNESGQYTFKTLDYVYDHFDVFKLILCKSQGTEYEHYIDRLSAEEEKAYKYYIEKQGLGDKFSELFIHVICQEGYRYIKEIVEHDLTKEEAVKFMKEVIVYNAGGLEAVLGQ